jgi:hypothetical protein
MVLLDQRERRGVTSPDPLLDGFRLLAEMFQVRVVGQTADRHSGPPSRRSLLPARSGREEVKHTRELHWQAG